MMDPEMSRAQFTSSLILRVEPELRSAIKAQARQERTTVAEWMRRALRGVVRSDPLASRPVE